MDGGADLFAKLSDDLIIIILSKLSSSAVSPSHLMSVSMTCKRLQGLCVNPMVLEKASPECYRVRARNWCDSAHRFMKLYADAGNIEACYTLGMIEFYCLRRQSGSSMIKKAASHAYTPALYSLGVMTFHGSGLSEEDRDPHAGVLLYARAVVSGHIQALHELGHCLEDRYGIPQISSPLGACSLMPVSSLHQ